jgi:DNA-binding GntR family transcriptional regulator
VSTTLTVAPLRTFRPLSEEVYDVLRAAILSGRLAPGARLVEADVARQMSTSRSPVREAVRKLEREGMLEYKPRRGTVVVALSREDVWDAYRLRAHLEAYAASLAAARASDQHVAQLSELIERMRRSAAADDLAGLLAADVDFHRLLCEASGSRRLVQVWRSLDPERWTLLSGLRARGLSLAQLAERHWPIVAALGSRTPETAEGIVRTHILELAEHVLGALDASSASGASEGEVELAVVDR